MATIKFLGNAPAIKQIDTYTPSAVSIGHTFWLICNGKVSATFTATTTTVADVTAGLLAILNSSAQPPPAEFADVTWSDQTTYLKATSKTNGQPFTFTTGGTGTLTQATPTTPSGPNDLSLTANWVGGVLPANSDTIVFENSATDVLYGLDQSAITGVTIRVEPTFSGRIGLPRVSTAGYVEYRETYLKYGITSLIYEGTGSRGKFNAGSTSCIAQINNTGTSSEPGIEPVLLRGSTLAAIYVSKGSVGVAIYADETSGVTNAETGSTSASLRFGIGCTLVSLYLNGGTAIVNQSVPIAMLDAGATLTQNRATGTFTSLQNGGTVYHNSQGTITSYTGRPRSTLDLSKSMISFTMTNTTLQSGSAINDPHSRATFTNGITLSQCHLSDVRLELGVSRVISVT